MIENGKIGSPGKMYISMQKRGDNHEDTNLADKFSQDYFCQTEKVKRKYKHWQKKKKSLRSTWLETKKTIKNSPAAIKAGNRTDIFGKKGHSKRCGGITEYE